MILTFFWSLRDGMDLSTVNAAGRRTNRMVYEPNSSLGSPSSRLRTFASHQWARSSGTSVNYSTLWSIVLMMMRTANRALTRSKETCIVRSGLCSHMSKPSGRGSESESGGTGVIVAGHRRTQLQRIDIVRDVSKFSERMVCDRRCVGLHLAPTTV